MIRLERHARLVRCLVLAVTIISFAQAVKINLEEAPHGVAGAKTRPQGGVRRLTSGRAGADGASGAGSAGSGGAAAAAARRPDVTAAGQAARSDGDSGLLLRFIQAAKQYRSHHGGDGGAGDGGGGGGDGGGGGPLLKPRDISRALYMGDTERLRSFVWRMATGENLTVALLGGSVSKGMGAVAGEPSFEVWLQHWLAAVAPAPGSNGAGSRVGIVNAACPATTSAYMNLCLGEYLRDPNVDLVLVEYAINDAPYPEPQMVNEPRKSLELLIRKLLRLPRRPAVVLLNFYRWYSQAMVGVNLNSDTRYFTNAEGQFFEFATYYGLPMISVKAAVYHHMAAGVHGFQVHKLRYETRANKSTDPEALFYEDAMHPSGLTGHRVISELVVGLLLHVARGLVTRPWRQSEEEAVVAPLPTHMLPDNWDTDLDRCLMGDKLRAAAVETQGFEWLNEGRNPEAPKWGYTALAINATIAFDLSSADADGALPAGAGADAAGQSAAPPPGAATAAPPAGSVLMVVLAYLRSYQGMGVAAVSCEGGCVCGDEATRGQQDPDPAAQGTAPPPLSGTGSDRVVLRLDGQWEHHHSQLQLGCFPARLVGSRDCRLRVRVEDGGRNGTATKVKLGGLIVSRTAPESARTMCGESLEAAERAAGYRVRRRRRHL